MAIKEECGNCRHFRVDGVYVSNAIGPQVPIKSGVCRYTYLLPSHIEHDECNLDDYHRVYVRAFRPTLRARIKDLVERIRYGVSPRRVEF